MARPTSFRLDEGLLERLEHEASAAGSSVTSLVSALLEEGLKTRRFPGIVYRDGETGRRAGLAGGPDVWEVIRAIRATPGSAEARLARLSEELAVPLHRLRLAVDFYAAHPDEIDARIATDEAAAEHVRAMVERRRQLMSS